MNYDNFWVLIRSFNELMKDSISGPDCTDPSICLGNCCGIQIDVPKILAQKYIELGYAKKEDFIRSNIFSFKLRFDDKKAKCFLFDPDINGCSVHHTGIKPPQCWIFPTGFNNKNQNIKCKRTDGWRINDFKKTKKAESLLQKYNQLCFHEAKVEMDKVTERIENSLRASEKMNIINKLGSYKPSELGGFQDSWDSIILLPAEGISLQMKKFCLKKNPKCKFLPDNFLDCEYICKDVGIALIKFLRNNIYQVINTYGINPNGHYPLYLLFEFLD
ncbi:MAG: hypothetical protein EU543_02840 [Promethearchaeota archaeon]|nr:MAG: hypothetical protein EU543_02840 [Candidatus Lokiarchaeota archaeon]